MDPPPTILGESAELDQSTHPPPPTNQGGLEIQESLEIQQPTAVRQSSMTDFITVRNHPLQSLDGLATTSLDMSSECNESSNDRMFVQTDRQTAEDNPCQADDTCNVGDNDRVEAGCNITIMNTQSEDNKDIFIPCEDNKTVVPSVCKSDKGGRCVVHDVLMKKIVVTSKKWADKGGGKGFGWKTVRKTKYQCSEKDISRIVTTTTNDRLGGRESTSVSDDSRKLGNDDVITGVLEYSIQVALGASKSDEINEGR